MTVGSPATFFTIANEAYFPGLVALVNSLRLCGHEEPIVVGDAGLVEWQRELVRPHCTIYPLFNAPTHKPEMCKPFGWFIKAKGTVAIIDSDMIVTKSLKPILALAHEGKICAFPDPDVRRWREIWAEIFELKAPLRHDTYVNAGLVVVSTDHHPHFLERWLKAFERIYSYAPTIPGGKEATNTNDQDALNALLMSDVDWSCVHLLPTEMEVFRWEFPEVSLVDTRTMECRFRGVQPMILHCCYGPKAWVREGVENNAYSRLLRRLLSGEDVPISIPNERLPLWLRRDVNGTLAHLGLAAWNYPSSYTTRNRYWDMRKSIGSVVAKLMTVMGV